MAGGGIAQRLTPVEFAALDSCGLAGLGLRTTDIREVRATSPEAREAPRNRSSKPGGCEHAMGGRRCCMAST